MDEYTILPNELRNKTVSLMMDNMASMAIEKEASDVLINISRDQFRTFGFYRAETMVETGRELALRELTNFFEKEKSKG